MRPDLKKEAERYVKGLIEKGENQQLDFKFEISDAKKMARTFSSFANTEGGKLLIGVKDNGKISGIRSEEEAYMAESAAHVFCRPPVAYNLIRWEVEGKNVLEVEIPNSKSKPHFAKDEKGDWIAYVRVGDQNIKANRVLIDVWRNRGRNNGVWLNYGQEEKSLIDYLKENEKITLTGFTRIARINRSNAEKILVKLILMKVIDVEITEKTLYFKLNPLNT
jgi:predicted HTH transcriptional regulator